MKNLLPSVLATAALAGKLEQNVFTGSGEMPNDDIQAHAARFNFDSSFLNNDQYMAGIQNQADIYVAIEAFSTELKRGRAVINDLEMDVNDHTNNTIPAIVNDLDILNEIVHDHKVRTERHAMNIVDQNTQIEGLYAELLDIAESACSNEKALVLFCHKFIYAPQLPDECAPILLQDTRLSVRYNWVDPTYGEDENNMPNPSLACTVIAAIKAEQEAAE